MKPAVIPWCDWWDEAVQIAQTRAIYSGRRQRVYRFMDRWFIEEVSAP